MEAAPLKSEIYTKSSKAPKIDIIDELIFSKDKMNYKIQFGIERNQDELLIIKLESEKFKNLFFYQQTYTLFELEKLSKLFTLYETMKDIIDFLKKLNFDIHENINDDSGIFLLFKIYLPDGQNEIIKLYLEKKFSDNNNIINNYLNEIKKIETNTLNNHERMKKEIYELKQKDEKNQKEIGNLKENINQYKKIRNILFITITSLIFIFSIILKNKFTTFKKSFLNDNIINDNEYNYENNIPKEPEKINTIFETKNFYEGSLINSIDFVIEHIKQKYKLININQIKLLYKSSRDSDNVKICHKLCVNKKNIIIIIKSDNNYIFGGYTKIGFKSDILKNSIDNKSFLFSVNLKKIYPAIKDKNVIGHIDEKRGLTFTGSIYFYEGFMKRNNYISNSINEYFYGFNDKYEMNGGKNKFIIKELEVYQLL